MAKLKEEDWNVTAARILEFVELNKLSNEELEDIIDIAEMKWFPSQWRAMMQIRNELRYLRNRIDALTSKKKGKGKYD